MERNCNDSDLEKDIYSNKIIYIFEYIYAIKYMPVSYQMTTIEKNRHVWSTFDTEEEILLEDQNMPTNYQNMSAKE